jgi:hypothetical protein
METGGGSALDGVTATPGVSAIPIATAPMTGSALRILMLDATDKAIAVPSAHTTAADPRSRCGSTLSQ